MAIEDQNIKIIIDSNAAQAAKDSNSLGKSLDGVEKSTKGVTKSTNDSSEATKKASKATKDQKDSLESLGGPIGSTISGFKAMLKQMWLLVANPLVLAIVAIVGGLALLFKAFTSTKAGGEQLERVMSGISAVIDVLRDRFLKYAGAIIKLMTGDFKGAIEDGKAAVSGFGAEVEKEFRQAANAAKVLQEVADATRDLGVQRSKLNRDLAQAKEIITDETASYAEKKKAINDVKIAEGNQTDQEIANAKRKLDAIKLANSLSDTGREDLQKQADAESALYNLEQESANNRRAINRSDKRADNEESTRLKALATERAAAQKVRSDEMKAVAKLRQDLLNEEYSAEEKALRKIQDLNDKTEEEKLSRQKERDLAEIEALRKKGIDVTGLLVYNTELYNTLEDELIQKRADEKAEKQKVIDEKIAADKKDADDKAASGQKIIDDAILEQKKLLEESRVNLTNKTLGFLSAIAGKNKILQKAAIIAENAVAIGRSLIANAAGNAQAFAVATPLLVNPITAGPAAVALAAATLNNNVATGLGVATSIAATAKALQAVGGGSGGSAPSVGGGGGARGGGQAAPAVAFNNTSENQIGQSVAARQSEQPPIKVIVSESDITDAQTNVKVLVSKNTF
jgi:hypothetical protein